MAGIWADFPSGSQGLYGNSTAAMLEGPWAQVGFNLVSDPDPAIGSAGVVFYTSSSTNSTASFVLPSAQTTVGIAERIWLDAIPSNRAGPHIMGWVNSANQLIGYVYITPTGSIAFVNGSSFSANPTFESSGPAVTASGWYHIEGKLTCSLSGAASVEVRVNGIVKLLGSSFTTSDSTIARVSFARGDYSSVIGGRFYMKDLAIWDGSGTRNNNFLGTVTVFFQPVDSDITLGGWTCSSGTSGSALIGHVGPPVDTNYIAADATPPAPAEFTMMDLPPDVTSVRYIVPLVRAAKVDGGDGNIQAAISPDGVNYDTGPDTPITSAMTYWGNAAAPFVSELDPATSAPWTPSGFNGARIRIDRTV